MTAPASASSVLSKGANVSLRQLDAELGSVTVVLEWASESGQPTDADISVLLLGHDGRVRSNDDLIFYNQPQGADGAVRLRNKTSGQDEEDGLSSVSETVAVDLDDLPESVVKVVLAASLDAESTATFGELHLVRLRLLRASDAHELLRYDITDATSETALLFGELYRRADDWKFRAVGQGWASGLAGLVTDFGIEVDSPDKADVAPPADRSSSTDPLSADHESPIVDESDAPAVAPTPMTVDLDRTPPGEGDPAPTRKGRISVGRSRAGAPRLPTDRQRARLASVSGELDWEPARLFPIAGIGAGEEQERRATSAFLAVLSLVKEFGRAIADKLGAPAGLCETFIEVPFDLGENRYRPDGVIRITRGKRVWTALLEVKTAAGELRREQMESYIEIAREQGFDAVVSVSNQIAELIGGHPVTVDRRKLRKVRLHHLSWDEVRTEAILISEHRGVADQSQGYVLREFVRYLEHARSGAEGFADMGPDWVRVRESVKAQTLRVSDKGALPLAARIEQLFRFSGLHLATLLGTEVSPVPRRVGERVPALVDQLVDSGVARGSLRVPGTVGPMEIALDLRAERISLTITVDAPREGRPLTRVNWLVRQLKEAPDRTRIEAQLAGPGRDSTAELLGAIRHKPELLLPPADRTIRTYRISIDAPMGTKRGLGRGSLITSVLDLLVLFYGDVVQHLRPWSPKPPQLPESLD